MAERVADIDAYVRSTPGEVRETLEAIRAAIQRAVPDAVEAIAYQMPTFKLAGKNLIHFGAWKHHIAVYPVPAGTKALQRKLAPFATAKGTLRFRLGTPVPLEVIEEVAAARAREVGP
jgi:uncharacterized protein YdhG (YjbR/CyaY superfamily)